MVGTKLWLLAWHYKYGETYNLFTTFDRAFDHMLGLIDSILSVDPESSSPYRDDLSKAREDRDWVAARNVWQSITGDESFDIEEVEVEE